MTDLVKVPFDGDAQEKAVLLLAAAEELGADPRSIRFTNGAFLASQEIVDQAFGDRTEKKADPVPKKAPAKKAAAKKTAAKKSASNKKTQE